MNSGLNRFIATATFLAILFVGGTSSGQAQPADEARNDKAREYLKLAQENLAAAQSHDLADMGLRDISCVQAALGDLPAALQTAEKIHFMKEDTLADIARVEARHGTKQKAIEILHNAVAGVGGRRASEDLATLAVAEAELGDLDGARLISAKVTDVSQRAPILCAIACADAKAGDLAGARESFAAAKKALSTSTDRYPPMRPGEIAFRQFDAGDVAGARETADAIADPSEKAGAYAGIGAEMAKKGDKAAARELLELARKSGGDDQGFQGARLLAFLGQTYAKIGDADAARKLFVEARAKAEAIDEQSEWRPETLADVAIAERTAGDAAAARDTMKAAMNAIGRMTNSGNATHAYWMIAGTQASDGDVAGAHESLASALKGSMDPSEIAMQAARVAGALTRIDGVKADLSWIDKLDTPEEKGLAYAGAAAGMFEEKEDK